MSAAAYLKSNILDADVHNTARITRKGVQLFNKKGQLILFLPKDVFQDEKDIRALNKTLINKMTKDDKEKIRKWTN